MNYARVELVREGDTPVVRLLVFEGEFPLRITAIYERELLYFRNDVHDLVDLAMDTLGIRSMKLLDADNREVDTGCLSIAETVEAMFSEQLYRSRQ
jgi:hypothetical protein